MLGWIFAGLYGRDRYSPLIGMPRVPPGLLGAALLFWGWRTGLLPLGIAAGAILEAAALFKSRWEFTDKDLGRLWDVCMLIFAGVAVMLRFSEDLANAAYKFFQWFPLIFFPMALGQVYSSREGIPFKAFSWFLRRKGTKGGERPIAFGWAYFAACIVAAGATNRRDPWFYVGVAVLCGAGLWAIRPRRLSMPGWAAVFLLAVLAGYYSQGKMRVLQGYLENRVSELLVHLGRREFDPRESRTAIGRIGSLKQSSRIALKLVPETGQVPERLRQGTYFRYNDGVWGGSRRRFDDLPVQEDLTTWTLIPGASNYIGSVRIIERLAERRSMLSLPLGTSKLLDLASGGVETNRLGLVRAIENPGLASYAAVYGAFPQLDQPPRGFDLEIPAAEQKAIREVADSLGLEGLGPKEVIAGVSAFFAREFGYTTYQSARILGMHSGTPLAVFLRHTKAGHCEYFATATVLLLREFGIPARYATGYAVQESSREGGEYVIRDRHAHAWVMAFVNGRWLEVDTTPGHWAQAEERAMPGWQPLKDWWQNLAFGFLEWRWLGERGLFRQAGPWLIGVLAVFLGWRIFGRRMSRAAAPEGGREIWPGADSDFYLLERKLRRAGLVRLEHETAAQWAGRVRLEAPRLESALAGVVRLHYKYRFDPRGMLPAEREELRRTVQECLART